MDDEYRQKITKVNQAQAKMIEYGFTEEQQDFIFGDWANWDEHIPWLLTASKAEITSWAESANWGKE